MDRYHLLPAEAKRLGIGTSMLEHIGSGYVGLHNDVKNGGNVAWQRYIIGDYWICGQTCSGGKYYDVDMGKDPLNNPNLNATVSIVNDSKFLSQYMNYVRLEAVRIGTTDPSGLDSVAFINSNGKYVVVVKTSSSNRSFSVAGLPAGTYGISYVTNNTVISTSNWRVNLTDQSISPNGTVSASTSNDGVVTIYAKTAGSSTPTPTSAQPTPTKSPTPLPPTPTPTPIGDVNGD